MYFLIKKNENKLYKKFPKILPSLQYTVHTKRVPFDSDNEVSPYSLSPLSNKRYETSPHTPH